MGRLAYTQASATPAALRARGRMYTTGNDKGKGRRMDRKETDEARGQAAGAAREEKGTVAARQPELPMDDAPGVPAAQMAAPEPLEMPGREESGKVEWMLGTLADVVHAAGAQWALARVAAPAVLHAAALWLAGEAWGAAITAGQAQAALRNRLYARHPSKGRRQLDALNGTAAVLPDDLADYYPKPAQGAVDDFLRRIRMLRAAISSNEIAGNKKRAPACTRYARVRGNGNNVSLYNNNTYNQDTQNHCIMIQRDKPQVIDNKSLDDKKCEKGLHGKANPCTERRADGLRTATMPAGRRHVHLLVPPDVAVTVIVENRDEQETCKED